MGTNDYSPPQSFSALQRAEIAEIALNSVSFDRTRRSFSALQRAEIAEIVCRYVQLLRQPDRFSALQRAEIAEIASGGRRAA